MFVLSKRSRDNLKGVHPDLVKVIYRALEVSDQDFTVIEGLRTIERQRELVRTGFSKTMNSRHLTGHAVDVVPYPIYAHLQYPDYMWDALAAGIKRAARETGVRGLEWGYDKWGWDKPHWQLSWKRYPK